MLDDIIKDFIVSYAEGLKYTTHVDKYVDGYSVRLSNLPLSLHLFHNSYITLTLESGIRHYYSDPEFFDKIKIIIKKEISC